MSNNHPSDLRMERVAAQAFTVSEIVRTMRECPEPEHRQWLEEQVVGLRDDFAEDCIAARGFYDDTRTRLARRELSWTNLNKLTMEDIERGLSNLGAVSTLEEHRQLQAMINQTMWVYEQLAEFLRLGGCPPTWTHSGAGLVSRGSTTQL